MINNINFLDVKEFREKGYLQEANRLFFHPLGLALSVDIDKEGNESFGGIWDYRDDPEGMTFAPGVLSEEKAEFVRITRINKRPQEIEDLKR